MKANIVTSLRPQYELKALLKELKLPRATYYDRLKRAQHPDKYAKVKAFIKQTYYHESRATYGYRRMHVLTVQAGFSYCEETIRKIMRALGIKCKKYSEHTSGYHSYKGKVGKVAPNILKQRFDAVLPLTVLHTDVTEVALASDSKGYISAITDEASREVLAIIVSNSPNKTLIKDTLDELKNHLMPGSRPILHSDQGWQYQIPAYPNQLELMNIAQSMSRKGNCHDNAPIESFFNLLKRECLNYLKFNTIDELRQSVNDYAQWFNNERISMNIGGMTPVGYRELMCTEELEA